MSLTRIMNPHRRTHAVLSSAVVAAGELAAAGRKRVLWIRPLRSGQTFLIDVYYRSPLLPEKWLSSIFL
ncbi:MAG: hypothetical protein GY924_06090 [Planctomycetaceae bacterium]|nr:hypothetical protein [Planctomycetaceae bacterium]